MATLTVELPESLMVELDKRHISEEALNLLVARMIEALLQVKPEIFTEDVESLLYHQSEISEDDAQSLPFSESALPFIEQLLEQNQTLFKRLAKL
jgi:hypothetical protein